MTRPVVKSLDGGTKDFGRENFLGHAVVLVEDAGILNPERKLRRSIFRDGFAVEYGSADTGAVAAGPDEITDIVRSYRVESSAMLPDRSPAQGGCGLPGCRCR